MRLFANSMIIEPVVRAPHVLLKHVLDQVTSYAVASAEAPDTAPNFEIMRGEAGNLQRQPSIGALYYKPHGLRGYRSRAIPLRKMHSCPLPCWQLLRVCLQIAPKCVECAVDFDHQRLVQRCTYYPGFRSSFWSLISLGIVIQSRMPESHDESYYPEMGPGQGIRRTVPPEKRGSLQSERDRNQGLSRCKCNQDVSESEYC